ncbi:MAG: Minf_1886 family protein, partial [Gemmatimonadaceae bacterium]
MADLAFRDGVMDRIRLKESRYDERAYLFVLAALEFCQQRLIERRHLTGRELALGCRDLALERYGVLARSVLEHWGIRASGDLGEVVFTLVDVGLLHAQPNDDKADFVDVFDFTDAFDRNYPWRAVPTAEGAHDRAGASAMTVRVCTGAGMRARETEAFAAGRDPYEVMGTAGEGVAAVILARYPEVRTQGAIVFAGTGNNGGDGWVIAGALAREGCPVQVEALGEPTTADAQRAKGGAASVALERAAERGAVTAPAVVVDALLGVGTMGEPRGAVAEAIARIEALRAHGARVVAAYLPSGIDATTGAGGRVVHADCTVTFD